MMDKPLVSIITPAYNAEPYLEEAIKSAQAQVYQNWEMIIVDDGSTDGTAEIAKAHAAKDPRIRYFYQTNQRMASARNAGIALAKGQYIAFLDADNIFFPQKLEKQVACLESHPDCGICYGKIRHFYHGQSDVLYENPRPQPMDDIFRHALYQNFINVLSVMVRKEAFDKYGAFQPGWWGCDEHFVWINLSYHGIKFFPIDEVVGLERLHRDSDSRQAIFVRETAKCFLQLLDIVESWLTPDEKIRYGTDIAVLRGRWKKVQFVGTLLANPVIAPVLMPLYLWRRNRQYKLIRAL